ncbi:MAG: beta strand repeat-containing protein [Phycisphaerales bacterium]
MKNRCPVYLVAAAGLAVSSAAYGQTAVQWAAGVNGSWGLAANWSPAQVPDNAGPSTFNVTLPNFGVLYTVSLDLTRDVTDLTLDGTAQDTVLDLTGNDLDVVGNFSFNRSYVAGNGGANRIRVTGTSTFNDSMYMWADFVSDGDVVFAGSTTEEFCDTGFDHNGSTVNWTGSGDISLAGGSVFDHGAPSVFTIAHPGNSDLFGSGIDTFNNAGTINKTGTGVTTIRDLTFNNTGTVKVSSGTLKIIQSGVVTGGTLNGTKYQVEDAASFRVTDAVDVDLDIQTTNAEVTLVGATSTFNSLNTLETIGATGKLNLEAGRVFTTAGALQNNGQVKVSQTSRLDLSAAASNSVNTGTIEAIDGGTVRVKNGATLGVTGTVKATNGGTVEFESGAALANVSGASLVGGAFEARNGGIIRGAVLAGVTRLNSTVVVEGATSDIRNAGGVSILPNVTAIGPQGGLTLNGRDVVLANDLTVEGNASVAGNITVEAGTTLELASGRTITNFASGTFSNGRFTIRGELVADNLEIATLDTALVLDRDGGRLRNRTTGLDALNSLNTLGPNANITVANGRDLITLGTLNAAAGSQVNIGAPAGLNRTTVRVAGDFNANGAILMNGGEIVTSSNVMLGGRLGGNGLVTSNFVNMGLITPGFSPGLLQIDGNFAQTAQGVLDLEIGGTTPGIDHDLLRIRDVFRFGTGSGPAGTLIVSLLGGFIPVDGQIFTLIEAGAVVGDGFQQVNFSRLPGFVTGEVIYGENNVSVVFRLVPAPGAFGLLAAAGLFGLRRRRSASKR